MIKLKRDHYVMVSGAIKLLSAGEHTLDAETESLVVSGGHAEFVVAETEAETVAEVDVEAKPKRQYKKRTTK